MLSYIALMLEVCSVYYSEYIHIVVEWSRSDYSNFNCIDKDIVPRAYWVINDSVFGNRDAQNTHERS